MDLWIRSQDKEMLCKVECVELMHDDPVYAKIYANGKFPDLIVGCYEKQRALEVLDEIQKLLIGKIIAFKSCDKSSNEAKYIPFKDDDLQIKPLHRDSVVYEMPEEYEVEE